MRRALEEYTITGIKTNTGLFRRILAEPDFLKAEIHTKWLDEILRKPSPLPPVQGTASEDAVAIAAALYQINSSNKQSDSVSNADSVESSRWKLEGRRQQLDRQP